MQGVEKLNGGNELRIDGKSRVHQKDTHDARQTVAYKLGANHPGGVQHKGSNFGNSVFSRDLNLPFISL